MAGQYNHSKLRSTRKLVEQAESLLDRIEAGKQIVSGSGGGKSATYELDSIEKIETQLDDIIYELRCRWENGDTDVPEAYREIEPDPTCEVADFSGTSVLGGYAYVD